MIALMSILHDPYARELGQQFGEALQDARISQKRASLEMSVPESHITEMIQGKRHIPMAKLRRLGWDFMKSFAPRWTRGYMDDLLSLQMERGQLRMARAVAPVERPSSKAASR